MLDGDLRGLRLGLHWEQSGIELGSDAADAPAARRLEAKSVLGDFLEGLRNGFGNRGIGAVSVGQSGGMLRESGDDGFAQSPDVAGGGKRSAGGFGSVVNVALALQFAQIADGRGGVAGEF